MDTASPSRKVAVTGSTGMIGSHLVAEMVRAGYSDILLPVRNAGRVENLRKTFTRTGILWPQNATLTVVETDITDPARLAEIFRGVDTVFNCAGAIMTGDLSPQGLIANNVAVASALAEAAVAAGVRKIIHTSSIVVLAANQTHCEPITEMSPVHGDAHGSAYARSKFLADREIEKVTDAGISLNIVYPAVVLGEGDWSANGSSALIPMISRGLPFFTDGVMAYADVRDVARAFVAIDRSRASEGENFIVAGANLSYRELMTMGAEAAGKQKPFIKVGLPLALTAYGLIRAATALRLMKDRSVTRQNLDSVLYGNRYSGEKLTAVCGFRYTPARHSIQRIVRAYMSEK